MDFRVTLPEVLVLYHWDDAHLKLEDTPTPTVTAANDSDAREKSDNTTREATKQLDSADPYTINTNVNTDDPLGADYGEREVILQNAWAVRSLSSADVSLGVTIQQRGSVLKNVTKNTSTITVKDAVLLSDSASSGSGTAAIKLPSQWNEQMGSIKFKIDLSNAKHSGEYNSRATADRNTDESVQGNETDTFLLTLTGN